MFLMPESVNLITNATSSAPFDTIKQFIKALSIKKLL